MTGQQCVRMFNSTKIPERKTVIDKVLSINIPFFNSRINN
jgi:hypothetical protein